MTDKEKVEEWERDFKAYVDELNMERDVYRGIMEYIDDALALLKEQEPVEPKFDSLDGNVGRWRCGNCQISLGAVRPPYCWHCGRAVKWDE